MHKKDRYLWHKRILVAGILWITGSAHLTFAAISDNSGATLQLFSYYGTNSPKINGNITDGTNNTASVVDGTNNDEWKNAAVRKVQLKSSVDTIDATLYFTNDSNNLYVAVSTSMGNSSSGTYIALYFDQGIGGGNLDGILQGSASTKGEYYAKVYPNKATGNQFEDGSFNGTSWSVNTVPIGTGAGVNVGTSFNQAEFKIPFRGNASASASNSYLSLTNGQEVGFYIVCFSQGGNKTYTWTAANNSTTNPQTAPGWAELRLGVSASFMTFYATANVNGNPSINGDITGDDAWRGSYRRDIMLSNFNGATIPATIYATQDAGNNMLYIGLSVNDATHNNPGDYCAIYQEQDGSAGASSRDYLLGNHDNALIANEGGVTHQYWNATQWTESVDNNQSAIGKWYASSNSYQYEYKVYYNGGLQSLNAIDDAFLGFLIRYHDGGSNSDFYWNYSANATAITTDQNTQGYTAIGEANIQLGAPYSQVVFPEDGSNVEGIVNLRVLAVNYDNSSVDYVQFYRKSVPGTKFSCTQVGSTREWSGTFDVSSLANGPDTLVIETKGNGITLQRLVNIVVSNSTGAAVKPTINLSSPAPGSTIGGTQTLTFTAATTSGTISATEISIDGADFVTTTTSTSHNLATSTMTEGTHTIQLRATNSSGLSATTQVISFTVKNVPTVTLISPVADTLISGITTILFHDSCIAPATITKKEIWINGSKTGVATDSTFSWNTVNLTDGQYTIQVRVTDNNGRVGMSEPVAVLVNNSPSVVITAPSGGATVSGKISVDFTNQVVLPSTITSDSLFIDGKTYQPLSVSGHDSLNTTMLSDGEHAVFIKATASNGKNSVSQTLTLLVRNSPVVTLTAPSGGSKASGIVGLNFTNSIAAPATIVSDSLFIDGKAFKALNTAGTDSLNTTVLVDGEHTIYIKATASNGKTGVSNTITLVVRNSPVAVILSPRSDTLSGGIDTIKFTSSAVAPATIIKREIWVDGSKLDTTTTATTYIWNTTRLNDGQHSIQVRVTDSEDKTGFSEIVSVTISNTPLVAISSPVKNTILSGLDTILFTVKYPAGVTRDTTEIAFDGDLNWRPTSTPLSYKWKTTDFTDGSHTVQIRATGSNGKTGYSQITHFQINNSPIIDSIKTPFAGQILNGDIDVEFAYSNFSPVVSRLISIDGGNWIATQTDSSAVIQSTTLKDGSHTLAIKVIDDKGRSDVSAQRLFIVDNTPPLTADPGVTFSSKTNYAKTFDSVLVTVLVKDLIAGLDKDSGVVLKSKGIKGSLIVMNDNGKGGDQVAFDNIFTSNVKVTDTLSEISYTIITKDSLNNTDTITSMIRLDNTPPRVAFTLTPEPELPQPKTYFDKLIMKGSYSDKGGSGLSRVFISVSNDSGTGVNNSPVVLAPEDSVFSSVVMLIPGKNRIMLHATDAAGNMDSSITVVTYYEPKQTSAAGPSGGTVSSPDGAEVIIPADALLSTVEITITKVDPEKEPKPLNSSINLLNVCHEFGPDGIVFRKPVTLTLSYTDADLDKNQDGIQDVNPLDLSIVFWDGKTWRIAGKAIVDTTSRTVQVTVNHFTMYDLAVVKETVSTDLVAYWSSNPVKSSQGAYFTYSVPSAGNVGLWILDMAGNPVVELIKSKTPVDAGQQSPVKWSGSNVSGHFAGAGMYVYVFTFTNKSRKTTVIRKPIGLLR